MQSSQLSLRKVLKCTRQVREYTGQNVPECQSWKGPEGLLIHSPCGQSPSSDRGRVAEGASLFRVSAFNDST